MQKSEFNKEFNYLSPVKKKSICSKPIPPLVREFNLFIKQDELLCCKGRIAGILYYNNYVQTQTFILEASSDTTSCT